MKNINTLLTMVTQSLINRKIILSKTKCHTVWKMTINNSEREQVTHFGCNV
jgi:hypothetical protein